MLGGMCSFRPPQLDVESSAEDAGFASFSYSVCGDGSDGVRKERDSRIRINHDRGIAGRFLPVSGWMGNRMAVFYTGLASMSQFRTRLFSDRGTNWRPRPGRVVGLMEAQLASAWP